MASGTAGVGAQGVPFHQDGRPGLHDLDRVVAGPGFRQVHDAALAVAAGVAAEAHAVVVGLQPHAAGAGIGPQQHHAADVAAGAGRDPVGHGPGQRLHDQFGDVKRRPGGEGRRRRHGVDQGALGRDDPQGPEVALVGRQVGRRQSLEGQGRHAHGVAQGQVHGPAHHVVGPGQVHGEGVVGDGDGDLQPEHGVAVDAVVVHPALGGPGSLGQLRQAAAGHPLAVVQDLLDRLLEGVEAEAVDDLPHPLLPHAQAGDLGVEVADDPVGQP